MNRLPDQAVSPLEGENRLLTVLFADLSGSVEATAGLDAESAAILVNRALAEMATPIQRYGGKVDRFLGDGLLAYFGAPEAHEDDPDRAILAALEIEGRVRGLGLNATAGINFGEVYLGAIGSAGHREVTAMGPAVNLAARLQGKARPGQILVGEGIYRHARKSFVLAPVSLDIKGLAGPVRAYEVKGALSRIERVRGLEGHRVEMIGREEQLGLLRMAMDAAMRGQGRVVSVIGEAGLGKSRLVSELRRQAVASTGMVPYWLEGRCLDMTMSVSYWPFLDALREFFQLRADDDDARKANRILTGLSELASAKALPEEAVDDIAPVLGNLLSVRFGSDWDQRLNDTAPEQLKNRVFRSLQQLFIAAAKRRPLVLLLEDLHWADRLSIDLMSHLMETIASAPLLLICVARPEVSHGFVEMADAAREKFAELYVEIRLWQLSAPESQRLVEALLDVEELPASLKANIMTRSQGNPFFVEEVVRSLMEFGLVYRTNGHWRAKTGIEEFRVPEAVQTVVQSRVDRLDPASRKTLQIASVFGRLFRQALLAEVVSESIDLVTTLRDLQDRALIHLERTVPEAEYSFEHVLTQETVYHNLLRSDRSVLHGKVAEAVEKRHADDLDEYWEQLAYHYELAAQGGKAFEYLVKAGEKAARSFLNDQAATYFQRALARLDANEAGDLPESRRGTLRMALNESMADVLELIGSHDAARTALESALQSGQGDRLRQARLHRKIGETLRAQRGFAAALTAYAAAEEALKELDAESVERQGEWLSLQTCRITLHYFAGDLTAIEPLVAKTRPVAEKYGTPAQRCDFLGSMVLMNLRRERFRASKETVEYAHAMLAAAEESGDLDRIAHGRFNHGFVHLWADEFGEARLEFEAALGVAERSGAAWLRTAALTYLAMVHRRRNEVERAREVTGRALDSASAADIREYVASAQANQAWLAWRDGNPEETRRLGMAALELWHRLPAAYPFDWSAALPLLAVAVSRGDVDDAIRLAAPLLLERQQRLPGPVESALRDAQKAWDEHQYEATLIQLNEVLRSARSEGLL